MEKVDKDILNLTAKIDNLVTSIASHLRVSGLSNDICKKMVFDAERLSLFCDRELYHDKISINMANSIQANYQRKRDELERIIEELKIYSKVFDFINEVHKRYQETKDEKLLKQFNFEIGNITNRLSNLYVRARIIDTDIANKVNYLIEEYQKVSKDDINISK